MANNLPIKSTVIYGEDEHTKSDEPNVAPRKVRTLKSLMTPQTQHLFTINYKVLVIPRKAARGKIV